MLLAIVSCHTREEYSNAVRSTWLPSVPPELDVKFFRGRGAAREPLSDEVFLDCDDSYNGLPNKVQEIMRWAYEHGYDYAAKVDDDVVVRPREWYQSFKRCDFTGCQEAACRPGEIRTPYGFFYVLSRRTMQMVISAPLPGNPGSTHSHWHNNDEAFVSTILHINGIRLQHDSRYFMFRGRRIQSTNTKRSLRAPPRIAMPVDTPPSDWFAICIYLNWSGWHQTPMEVNLGEFKRIWKESQ